MTDPHARLAQLEAALHEVIRLGNVIETFRIEAKVSTGNQRMTHTGAEDYCLASDVRPLLRIARAALASAPAPDTTAGAVDIDAIEAGGKRWHGEDHRVVSVRWEPYKPDGQRQMKAKGRWQEQIGSGDYWRWQNCDRPAALRALAGETE